MLGGYSSGQPEVQKVVIKEPITASAEASLKDLKLRIAKAEDEYNKNTEKRKAIEAKEIAEHNAKLEALKVQILQTEADNASKLALSKAELSDVDELVSEKTRDLEVLEAAFTAKDGYYQSKRTEWVNGIAENEEVKKRNAAISARLDKREEELNAKEKQIDKNFAHADLRLSERVSGIAKREEMAGKRETAVTDREVKVLAREVAVSARENASDTKEKSLVEKENKLNEVQVDKDKLIANEARLKLWQSDLDTRKEKLDQQEDDIFLARTTQRAKEENIKKREQALKEAQNELKKSELSAN